MNYQSYEATRIQPGEQTRRMLDYMFPGYQRRDPRNWYEMQTQTDLDRYEINPLIGNELIETETVDLYEERKKSLLEKFPGDDDLEDEDDVGSPEAEKRPPAKRAHRSSVASRIWEGPPIRMAGKSSEEGFHLDVEDYYHDPQTILVPKEIIEHRELKMDIVPDEQGVPKVIIYLGPKDDTMEEITAVEVEQPQETIILYDGKQDFDENHSSDETTSAEESPVHSEHEIEVIEEIPSPEPSRTPVSEKSISPEPEPEPHWPTPEPEPVFVPTHVPMPVPEPPADESASVVYVLPPMARDSFDVVGPSVIRLTSEPEPSIISIKEEEVAVPEETEKVNSILLEPIRATGSHEDIYEEIIGETPPEPIPEPLSEPIPEPIPEVKEFSPIPSEKGVHASSSRDRLFSPLENYPKNLDEEPYKPHRESPRKISTSSPSSAKSPSIITSKRSSQSPSPVSIDHPLKVLDDHPPASPVRSSTPDSQSSNVSRWLESAIISPAKTLAHSPNPEPLESPKKMSAVISHDNISPDKPKPKFIDMNPSPTSSTSPDKSDFPADEKIDEWLEHEIVKPSEVNNWVDSKILSTAKKPDDEDRKPPKRDSTSPGNDVDEQIDEWMDKEILQPAQQKRLIGKLSEQPRPVREISEEPRPVKGISVVSEEPDEIADKEVESWIGNEIVQPAEVAVWVDKEIIKPINAEKWLEKQVLQPSLVDSYVDKEIVKPASDEAFKWSSPQVPETEQQPVEDAVKRDSEEKPRTFFQPEVDDESKSPTSRIEEDREKSPVTSPMHDESPEKIDKKSFEVPSGIPTIPSILTTTTSSSAPELKVPEKPPSFSVIGDGSEPELRTQEEEKPLPKSEQEEPSRAEAPLEAPILYLGPFQPHPDHPDDFPRAQNLLPQGHVTKVTGGDKEPQPEPQTHDDSAMRDKGMMSQEGIAEAKKVIDKSLTPPEEMSPRESTQPEIVTEKKEPSEGGLKRKPSIEPKAGETSPGSSISKLEKLDRPSILAKKALETDNYLLRDEDDDYSKPWGSTGSVSTGNGKRSNGKKKCPIGNIFKKKRRSSSPSPFSRNFPNTSERHYSTGAVSVDGSSKKDDSLEGMVKSSNQAKKDTPEMPSNITSGEPLSPIQESSKEFDSTPTKTPPSSLAQSTDDEKNKSDTGPITTPYAPEYLNQKSSTGEQKPYSLSSPKPTMSSKTDGLAGTAMIPDKQASIVLPDDILTSTFPKFVDTVDKVERKKKSEKDPPEKLPDPPKKGYPEFPDYKDLISPKERPEPTDELASKIMPADVPKAHSDNAGNKTDSPLMTSSFTQTQRFDEAIKKTPTASSLTVSQGDSGKNEPPSRKDHGVATVKKVGEPESTEFASSTEPDTPGQGIPRFPDYDELTMHPQHDVSLPGQPIPYSQIRPPTSSPQSVPQVHPYPLAPENPSYMNQPTHSQQQIPAPNLPSSRPYNVTQPSRPQPPPSARPTLPRQQDSMYSPYRPVQPPYYTNQSQLRAWKRPDDSRPQQVPIQSPRPQEIPMPSERFHTKPHDQPMLIQHNYSHPEEPLKLTSERSKPLFEQQTPPSKPVMDSATQHVPDYSGRYVPRHQQEPTSYRKPQFEKAQIPPSPSFKPSQQHSVPKRSLSAHPDQHPALKEHNYSHPDQPLPLIYGMPSHEQLQSDTNESHSAIGAPQEHDSELNKPIKPGRGVPKFPDYPGSRPAEQHPPMMTGDHLPKDTKPKMVTAADKKTEIDNEMLPIMLQIADLKRRMYELTPEKGPPIVTGPGHTSRRLPTSRQLYDELETRTMDATKEDRDRANTEKRKQVYEESARRKIQRAIERSQQNKR